MKNLVYHGFLFVFIVITAFIDIGNKIIMRWLSPIEAAALVAAFGAFFALGSSLLRVVVFKTKKKMSFSRATYVKLLLLGIGAGSALIVKQYGYRHCRAADLPHPADRVFPALCGAAVLFCGGHYCVQERYHLHPDRHRRFPGLFHG